MKANNKKGQHYCWITLMSMNLAFFVVVNFCLGKVD